MCNYQDFSPQTKNHYDVFDYTDIYSVLAQKVRLTGENNQFITGWVFYFKYILRVQ